MLNLVVVLLSLFLLFFFSAENEAIEGNTKCDVIMGTSHYP